MAIYAPDEPTRAKLREFFSYNPETGSMRWAKKYVNRHVGAECSTVDNQGYRRVQFMRREYAVHRLAWFLHYGEWPAQLLDHINRDRMDNRIANLRLATYSLNALNSPVRNHLTEAERQQVCDLYLSGKSGDQIALMFNRDKTTINKILRKRGIAARPQRQRSAALPPPVIKHPIERLWREVGLPEWFLGNGGTNTKLYALYDAILSLPVQPGAGEREAAIEECAKLCDTSKIYHMNEAGYFKDANGNWTATNMRGLQDWQKQLADDHVAKSNEAMSLASAIRALSRQAPHSGDGGGR